MFQFLASIEVYGLNENIVYGNMKVKLNGLYSLAYLFKIWYDNSNEFCFICNAIYEYENFVIPTDAAVVKYNEIVWEFNKLLSTFKHYEISTEGYLDENNNEIFSDFITFIELPSNTNDRYRCDSAAPSIQTEMAAPLLTKMSEYTLALESEIYAFPKKTDTIEWAFA